MFCSHYTQSQFGNLPISGSTSNWNLPQNQTPSKPSRPGSSAKHAKAQRTQRILQNKALLLSLRTLRLRDLCVGSTGPGEWSRAVSDTDRHAAQYGGGHSYNDSENIDQLRGNGYRGITSRWSHLNLTCGFYRSTGWAFWERWLAGVIEMTALP